MLFAKRFMIRSLLVTSLLMLGVVLIEVPNIKAVSRVDSWNFSSGEDLLNTAVISIIHRFAYFRSHTIPGVTIQTQLATPPSPPQNLTAVASAELISLNWFAPSSNGGSPITGYNIWRRSSPSGPDVLIATLGNLTSYADWSIARGGLYKVTALNSAGESASSNYAYAAFPRSSSALPTLTLALLPALLAAFILIQRRRRSISLR